MRGPKLAGEQEMASEQDFWRCVNNEEAERSGDATTRSNKTSTRPTRMVASVPTPIEDDQGSVRIKGFSLTGLLAGQDSAKKKEPRDRFVGRVRPDVACHQFWWIVRMEVVPAWSLRGNYNPCGCGIGRSLGGWELQALGEDL